MSKVVKFHVMLLGNTLESHKTFLDHLTISPTLREASSMEGSDIIIAFVPIVSRGGTDVSAAMERIPKSKPVVLVVLHHTFEKNFVVPSFNDYVNRSHVFLEHCLFHEDEGMLRCPQNDEAIKAVKSHMIQQAGSTVARNSYRWTIHVGALVVSVILGVILGVCAGITAGIVTSISSFVVFSLGYVTWAVYNRKRPTRHGPPI